VQFRYELLQHSAPSGLCPVKRCFDSAEKKVAVVTHNGAVLDIRAFPIKEAGKVTSVLLLVSDIFESIKEGFTRVIIRTKVGQGVENEAAWRDPRMLPRSVHKNKKGQSLS